MIEVLVVIALVGLIIPTIASFIWRGFEFNRHATGSIFNQQNARRLMDKLKSELREVSPGAGNQYALEVCEPLAITYYADADQDGIIERMRYFVDGRILKRGITEPSGGTYPGGTEVLQVIMDNVLNDAGYPVFTYFNRAYTGTEAALTTPVSCPEVRAVKIALRLDTVLEAQPGPFQMSSIVQFRNLKNNF